MLARALARLKSDGPLGLARAAKRLLFRRGERSVSATSVTHAEAIAWFERRREGYDELIDAVAPHVAPDATIMDVGANIGYFTLLLAQRIEFRSTAHLFEPLPHLAELCKMTFQDQPYEVHVHNFGLSDADAEVEIFQARDGNLGWNTLVAEKATNDMIRVPVRLKSFANAGIDFQPSFIKLDVEGAEYRVLGGMLDSLRSWSPKPVILCEVGWGQSHPSWSEELAVFDELARMGYKAHSLSGKPIDVRGLTATTDVLFLL